LHKENGEFVQIFRELPQSVLAIRRAEEERRKAEAERFRADSQERRADQLAVKLRELGVDRAEIESSLMPGT
jgi:hypothetical protein